MRRNPSKLRQHFSTLLGHSEEDLDSSPNANSKQLRRSVTSKKAARDWINSLARQAITRWENNHKPHLIKEHDRKIYAFSSVRERVSKEISSELSFARGSRSRSMRSHFEEVSLEYHPPVNRLWVRNDDIARISELKKEGIIQVLEYFSKKNLCKITETEGEVSVAFTRNSTLNSEVVIFSFLENFLIFQKNFCLDLDKDFCMYKNPRDIPEKYLESFCFLIRESLKKVIQFSDEGPWAEGYEYQKACELMSYLLW